MLLLQFIRAADEITADSSTGYQIDAEWQTDNSNSNNLNAFAASPLLGVVELVVQSEGSQRGRALLEMLQNVLIQLTLKSLLTSFTYCTHFRYFPPGLTAL